MKKYADQQCKQKCNDLVAGNAAGKQTNTHIGGTHQDQADITGNCSAMINWAKACK
jgi:hypothetical protein